MADAPDTPKRDYQCSFCGKRRSEVTSMIAGDHAFICDKCLALSLKTLRETAPDEKIHGEKPPLTPSAIKGILDQYVVGQGETKKKLAVAVYNHFRRTRRPANPQVELAKANILLIGPTGSGKTLLAQTLARALDAPFVIADATTLTEAGYVGEDVENIIQKLLQRCDYDAARAQRGLVYIDEIDKIARMSENPSITRDVSGEGVQQALLKLIEGTIASVPPAGGRKHPQQDYVNVDTTDILFVCGGAFNGLDDIVRRRVSDSGVGFNVPLVKKAGRDAALARTLPEDLVRFGLIPELVGRLPVVGVLNELDEEALVRIFNEPKNALARQYACVFEMEGADLEITPAAVRAIAKKAIARGTGARGLRAVAEDALLDTMFTLPDRKGEVKKIVVDEPAIDGVRPPRMRIARARTRKIARARVAAAPPPREEAAEVAPVIERKSGSTG